VNLLFRHGTLYCNLLSISINETNNYSNIYSFFGLFLCSSMQGSIHSLDNFKVFNPEILQNKPASNSFSDHDLHSTVCY
jgi:hypothetical protein